MSAQVSTVIDYILPDLGTPQAVVNQLLVQAGEAIAVDQPLLALETEKASMEVPSAQAGVLRKWLIAVGDTVRPGQAVAKITVEAAPTANVHESSTATIATKNENYDLPVPDLGSNAEMVVLQWLVQAGDVVAIDQTVVVLEGEKASVEVPCPRAGEIKELLVKVGSKVKTGSPLLRMQAQALLQAVSSAKTSVSSSAPAPAATAVTPTRAAMPAPVTTAASGGGYASPSIRRLAREFGVDLRLVPATGRKGRIMRPDVQAYVRQALAGGGGKNPFAHFNIAEITDIDFSSFGPTSTQSLSKIKRLTAQNLHRNWLLMPHVTQFASADITELEAVRKQQTQKITLLPFLMKAMVTSLQAFPQFNASLDRSGEQLILKKYFNVGVAIDTPNGLVVAVIREVDQKSPQVIAAELGEVSKKAREKGLAPKEMQGGGITISSLGGIGGTAFTPIINYPEVAILGVSRSSLQPVWQENQFVPRLLLPLSLSYDHRVIDGAEAAKFITHYADTLAQLTI